MMLYITIKHVFENRWGKLSGFPLGCGPASYTSN